MSPEYKKQLIYWCLDQFESMNATVVELANEYKQLSSDEKYLNYCLEILGYYSKENIA